MGQWDGAQGQVKVSKKMQKQPHLLTFPPANLQTKNKKFFFRCQLEDLLNL